MISKKVEKTLKFLISSGIGDEEILSKLENLQKFQVLPSFVLCSKRIPNYSIPLKWHPRLFEEFTFSEYKENLNSKLNFDYLEPKTKENPLNLFKCFHRTFITGTNDSIFSINELDSSGELNEIFTNSLAFNPQKDQEEWKTTFLNQEPPELVWFYENKFIIRTTEIRSTHLNLWILEEGRSSLVKKNTYESESVIHYDPNNSDNIFLTYTSVNDTDLNVISTSSLEVLHSMSLGGIRSRIPRGLLITREEIILMTDSNINFYDRDDKVKNLTARQSVGISRMSYSRTYVMTAVSDNLIDVQISLDHHLYLKKEGQWIDFQVLSYHHQGQCDNLLKVPCSYELLTRKAKMLPLDLPLDLIVEVVTFLC